jgi:general secretion pathway protein E
MPDLWMTSLKAEISRRSPAGSSSATINPVSEPVPSTRLPFNFARDQQVVLDGTRLIVGPQVTSIGLREAQRRIGQGDVHFVQETAAGFETALMRIYQASGSGAQEEELSFDLEGSSGAAQGRDLLDEAGDAPVIQLVNLLLRRAVSAGASDLHLEPHEGGIRARMRIDGFLQTMMDRSDVPVRRVISRLKVMAGLDIAETRLPQDGRIPLRLGGRVIDTRVSSLPGNYGERIVVRILDRSAGLMPLVDLGLGEAQIDLLNRMSALPNGIILATGPTGAGKTTTLYSMLQLANQAERNIVTVEDPIEYDLPGISQSQINAEIGMTFAAGLRATLRQDPDVILVGEIRDGETASTASQAALTGHLVFSSLHANGSVGAVVRLRDLGLDNFLIAATLRGVIAQRLLRRLCAKCTQPHPPKTSEAQHFTTHNLPLPLHIYAPVGCDACGDSGYAGRVGIFEMIEVGEALRSAIDRGASEAEMKAQALDADETLITQGLREVAAGRTSLTEVLRVVGDVA